MKSKKIMSLQPLQETVHRLQLKGEKIVFTNGCFDLIHAGHVRYLSKARSLGDALIVAFWFIDYLILFTGETPERLITALTPDILVKGGDWPLDRIIGRAHIEAHGGKVVRIKIVKGASTTSLIERVLARFQETGTSSIENTSAEKT